MPGAGRLVVLISGRGRNLRAIIDAVAAGSIPADIAAVVSNRGDAGGLAFARAANIPVGVLRPRDYPDRKAYDTALAEHVAACEPTFVALAGYMRILDSVFVQRFAGRLINIHPSLLPKYRGLDTHRRALAAGDARHGASIHFVSDELDAGPILVQGSVAVAAGDDEQRLAQRVMDRVETRIYPQALGWLFAGRAGYNNGTAVFDGRALEEPIHVDCD